MLVIAAFVGRAPAAQREEPREASLGVMPFTMESRPPSEQVRLAAELGYTGITCWYAPGEGTRRIEAFQATQEVRDGEVQFVAVLWAQRYDQPYDRDAFEQAVARLSATNTRVWLMLEGPPGDDNSVVRRTRELADQARPHGVTIVLYPHYKHPMADTEDALRVLGKVDRPNVKVSLHLCHELKAGNDERLAEVIRLAAPHLELVSVSGADQLPNERRQVDHWLHEIRPLDVGDFDVLNRYLRPLRAAGYRGPILLHTFGITDPNDEHLKRSRATWAAWQRPAGAEQAPSVAHPERDRD